MQKVPCRVRRIEWRRGRVDQGDLGATVGQQLGGIAPGDRANQLNDHELVERF